MEIKLKENERIDDLEYKGLKIIQNQKGFCFGIDAVLLSDFARNIKKDAKVLDLGTGTGIISILLCGKTNLSKIIGVEVQQEVADMAKRSSKLNNLEDKFEIINENIINLDKIYENNSFDAIVTNPPYKKENTGILNDEKKKLISRHEILAKLEDYIKISNKLLKEMLSKKYYKTIVMVDSWLANAGEVIAQTGYDDINIFGFDLMPQNKEALKQGKVTYIIDQSAYMQSYECVHKVCEHLIYGTELPKGKNYLPIHIYNKYNLD